MRVGNSCGIAVAMHVSDCDMIMFLYSANRLYLKRFDDAARNLVSFERLR